MFVVYWSQLVDDAFVGYSKNITGADALTVALALMEDLRKSGARFVAYASENTDSLTKPGVDAVVNGRLPNGTEYDWKKRRSA